MAKVDFNSMQDDSVINGANNAGNDVGFFTLKNDNDEAIVRFMCDSVDDFEILTVHEITVGGKFRKVNCIRDPREPLDNCPLCKNGTRISQRFFIKMLQYETVNDTPTGMTRVVPKAVIWERSTAYAKTLKSYIDNYGPLSDVICKVIRHGKAGDMQTTYEIVPNLSKQVFRDEIYVKDPTLFGDFQCFGTIVMDKSAEDLTQFLMTGSFPVAQNQNNNTTQVAPEVTPRTYEAPASVPPMNNNYNNQLASSPAPNYAAPSSAPEYAPVAPAQAVPTPAANIPNAPTPNVAPQFGAPANNGSWGAPTAGFDRPRRY